MYTDVVTIGEFEDLLPANPVWHFHPHPIHPIDPPTPPAAEAAPMITLPYGRGAGGEGFSPVTIILTDEDDWTDEPSPCTDSPWAVHPSTATIILTDPDDDDSDQPCADTDVPIPNPPTTHLPILESNSAAPRLSPAGTLLADLGNLLSGDSEPSDSVLIDNQARTRLSTKRRYHRSGQTCPTNIRKTLIRLSISTQSPYGKE